MKAIGNERLLTVDDVAALRLDRRGAYGLDVAARSRLGHRDGCDDVASCHAGQVALLLALGAEVQQIGRHDV
ncbi:hypothetical protein D3C86_1712310 [compost metagenome]